MDRKTKKWLKQLESKQAKERYNAVLALGKTGDTELIDTLDRVANLDEHHKVRDLAAKAVRTLEILKKRQLQREAAALDDDDDGGGYEWKPLVHEKIMSTRETAIQKSEEDENWSYSESKRRQIERETDAERAKREAAEADALAKEAARKRRRRPFRLFLLLVTFLMVLVAVFALWYSINVDPPPTTRAATLRALNELATQQQSAIAAYETELANDPLNCPALLAIKVPERPRWVELTVTDASVTVQAGALEAAADDLNRINKNLLVGLDGVMTDLDRTHARLLDLKNGTAAGCSGQESISPAEWTGYADMGGYIAQAGRSAESALNALSAELPPQNSAAAVSALVTLVGQRQTATDTYRDQLAADPVQCAAITGIVPPPRPTWSTTDGDEEGLLVGLEAVIEALDSIDTNLRNVHDAVAASCAGGGALPQASWTEHALLQTTISQTESQVVSTGAVLLDMLNTQ